MAKLTITELRILAQEMLPVITAGLKAKIDQFKSGEEYKRKKKEFDESPMIVEMAQLAERYQGAKREMEEVEKAFKRWKDRSDLPYDYNHQWDHQFLSHDSFDNAKGWLLRQKISDLIKDANLVTEIDEDKIVAKLLIANIKDGFDYQAMVESMKKAFGI